MIPGSDDQLPKRITLNPKVTAGKPVIKGTGLTVNYILTLLATVYEEARGIEDDSASRPAPASGRRTPPAKGPTSCPQNQCASATVGRLR